MRQMSSLPPPTCDERLPKAFAWLSAARCYALVVGGAIHNFFSRMIDALFVLYAVNSLRLGPADIGIVLAAGGPGALVGAVLVERFDRGLGVGPVLFWSQVLTGVSRVLIPLAPGAGRLALVVLAASTFLLGLARTSFNVTQVSLRIALTPDHLHGRVTASIRFLMRSITPLGALAGGFLASTTFGLHHTMLLAGIGVLTSAFPFLSRSLRSVREIPDRPNITTCVVAD